MSEHFLDIARKVLDRQVVDSNHIVCGKVDDLEIEGTTKLKVTALLLGNGVASARLPELAKYISRKIFGRRVVRIPWSEVEVITHEIKLRSTARELGLDERTGSIFKIISALPSSWKK
jgi:sporulation protein YlmC with PRC-barrel domain